MKTKYTINQKNLVTFSKLVSELGGTLDKVLIRANLQLKDLSNPKVCISYNNFIKLIEYAAVELNYPAFGLRLSNLIELNELGFIYTQTNKYTTFQEALFLTQQFLSLFSHCSDCWEVTKDKHLLIISRYTDSSKLRFSVQEKEFSYGIYLRVLQKIIGHSLKNCRIEFTHNNITELHAFKKFLKVGVAFNQECERLIIDSRFLNQNISAVNAVNYLHSNSVNLQSVKKLSIEQKVKNLIMQNMINKTHTIENIASRLDMHPRSLQRRLEEKNLTFKLLLNNLRIDMACWHLRASNKSVTLISEILGYNEVSSFSRSFKKHKKCSALQWRKSHAISL